MSDPSESCGYAVVCRLPQGARACASSPRAALQEATDLVVAIENKTLHVFSRRPDRHPSNCACGTESTATDTGIATPAASFHCPYITCYDDVGAILSIPSDTITQIWMTYETASSSTNSTTTTSAATKGVAKRTKDLVLRVGSSSSSSPSLLLWLEFEHNLSRGWFLEALTAAASPSSFDIDYLDLGDHSAVDAVLLQEPSAPQPAQQGASAITSASPVNAISMVFLRDLWRHVIYDKIKLALQISQESSMDGPLNETVVWLLTSAMELSTRLDEPDLVSFTWLTSGFLNIQRQRTPRSSPSYESDDIKSKASNELALAQVLHSLSVARENSLEYLSCLALQSAAEIDLLQYEGDGQTASQLARERLTEAAKLLTWSKTCSRMEPPLKMQLHAKLRELVGLRIDPSSSSNSTTKSTSPAQSTSPRSAVQRAQSVVASMAMLTMRDQLLASKSNSSSSLLPTTTIKATTAKPFSLYDHVFGTSAATTTTDVKSLLLVRAPKNPDANPVQVVVDLIGAQGVRKARFRVFYDRQNTFTWLQTHIQERFHTVWNCSLDGSSNSSTGGASDVRIELFYDPQRKQLIPCLETTRLGDWLGDCGSSSSQASPYVLHAKLGLRVVSSHRSSLQQPREASSPVAASTSADRSSGQPVEQGTASASVLCSLCGIRMELDKVEQHSETCF